MPATAERNATIWQMRVAGHTMSTIGAQFGITSARVSQILDEALKERIQPAADALRQFEIDKLDAAQVKLDDAEAAVMTVLQARHYLISAGGVVCKRVDGTGTWDEDAGKWVGAEWTELLDDAPVLAAVDRLVKIRDAQLRVAQRRAALLGLDAPVQSVVTSYEYTVNGVDPGAVK